MAKATLFATALLAALWIISPARSQPQTPSKTTILSSLQPGQSVTVADKGSSVVISTIEGVESGTHTVIEIGDDFIGLRDASKITESRVPVHAIRAIVHIKAKPM